MKKQMKTILFTLLLMLSTIAFADVSKNIFEKQKSPTPWLKDRFSDFLDCMPHNAVVIEVGVQEGTFASFILKKTNPKKLFLIDCWRHQDSIVYDDKEANLPDDQQEKLYLAVKKHFANDPRVIIIRKFSTEAASQFADESIDWIYIDANHSYPTAKEDLDLWWPKVKKGGILSGHDYIVRPSFGVVQALNEFLIKNKLSLSYLTVEEGQHDSWAIKKPL